MLLRGEEGNFNYYILIISSIFFEIFVKKIMTLRKNTHGEF
jgi:hypothetical protein